MRSHDVKTKLVVRKLFPACACTISRDFWRRACDGIPQTQALHGPGSCLLTAPTKNTLYLKTSKNVRSRAGLERFDLHQPSRWQQVLWNWGCLSQ